MTLLEAMTVSDLTEEEIVSCSLFSKRVPTESSKKSSLARPLGSLDPLTPISLMEYPTNRDSQYKNLSQKLKKSSGNRDAHHNAPPNASTNAPPNALGDASSKSLEISGRISADAEPKLLFSTNSILKNQDNNECPTIWARSLVFKTKDGGIYKLSEQDLECFRIGHKEPHIITCCRKAAMWLEANPTKRKSRARIQNFLLAWMNRAMKVQSSAVSTGGYIAGGLI